MAHEAPEGQVLSPSKLLFTRCGSNNDTEKKETGEISVSPLNRKGLCEQLFVCPVLDSL
jgi:hypothetical protein